MHIAQMQGIVLGSPDPISYVHVYVAIITYKKDGRTICSAIGNLKTCSETSSGSPVGEEGTMQPEPGTRVSFSAQTVTANYWRKLHSYSL